MKKQSLRSRIEERMREIGTWAHKAQIEKRGVEWGYMGDTTARRLREMESGLLSNGKTCPRVLEKKEEKGSVLYRWRKQEHLVSTFEIVGGVARESKQVVLI